MTTFREWLHESVDTFPQPQDLAAFISHATTVCIHAQQSLAPRASSPDEKALLIEINNLTRLLMEIGDYLQEKIQADSEQAPDQFQGKPTPSLLLGQYPHKFPSLPSVVKVLRTIGSHYYMDQNYSRELTQQLNRLDHAWAKVRHE